MTQSYIASLIENVALFSDTPADVLMTYEAPEMDDAQDLVVLRISMNIAWHWMMQY